MERKTPGSTKHRSDKCGYSSPGHVSTIEHSSNSPGRRLKRPRDVIRTYQPPPGKQLPGSSFLGEDVVMPLISSATQCSRSPCGSPTERRLRFSLADFPSGEAMATSSSPLEHDGKRRLQPVVETRSPPVDMVRRNSLSSTNDSIATREYILQQTDTDSASNSRDLVGAETTVPLGFGNNEARSVSFAGDGDATIVSISMAEKSDIEWTGFAEDPVMTGEVERVLRWWKEQDGEVKYLIAVRGLPDMNAIVPRTFFDLKRSHKLALLDFYTRRAQKAG